MPDFRLNTLIIGAGRSGTTTLFEYLRQHPEVCASHIKEVHFFSFDDLFKRGTPYLQSFFRRWEGKHTLTADTYLLAMPDLAERIYRYDSRIRLVVMLRDPVQRAVSNYLYSLRFGYEKPEITLRDSLLRETSVLALADPVQVNNLCHAWGSLYGRLLHDWLKVFPREQVFTGRLEDLSENRDAFLSRVLDFMELPDFDFREIPPQNIAAEARVKSLEQVLLNRQHPLRKAARSWLPAFLRKAIIRSGLLDLGHRLNRRPTEVPEPSPEDVDALKEYFREDIQLLKNKFSIEYNI